MLEVMARHAARCLEAITAFAIREKYEIVATFYDKAVKGSDPIETRPGFAALLDRIEGNGVRNERGTVIRPTQITVGNRTIALGR